VWQRFTPASRGAVLRAQNLATKGGTANVSPAHLFLGLWDDTESESPLRALLLRTGWNLDLARLAVEATLEPPALGVPEAEPRLTRGAKRVLELSADEARRAGDTSIESYHLLAGCLRLTREDEVRRALESVGWSLETLRAGRRESKANARPDVPEHPLVMLTGDAQKAVDGAYASMRATYCGRISTAHLLLGLLQNSNRAQELLEEIGVSPAELQREVRAAIRSDGVLATADKRFDKAAKRALDRAKAQAQMRGYTHIGADHLLLGLLPQRATMRETLTWGARVPDVAARLLAGADGARLRELAGPIVPLKARPAKPAGRDVSAHLVPLAFWGTMLGGSAIGFAGTFLPRRLSSSGRLILLGVVLSFVALGLGTCGALLFSRKKNLKSALIAAFFGALVGLFIVMAVRG